MKLTILGSGTFFVNATVSASAFVLEINGKNILIDCGPGTLVKLAMAGYKLEDIDYVFISHFHPDHSSDLFPLFMNVFLADKFTPGGVIKFPKFFGPVGLDKFLSDYSKLTELPAYDGWNKIQVNDYSPEMILEDFKVKTFKVTHAAFGFQARAYALRFEYDNKVIVFSGDTAMCEGIQQACENADVFVCDMSFPKTMNTNVHLNTSEVGEIAEKGKVKKLIVDHFYPQFDTDTLISEVKETYSGNIVKAKDLEVIEL